MINILLAASLQPMLASFNYVNDPIVDLVPEVPALSKDFMGQFAIEEEVADYHRCFIQYDDIEFVYKTGRTIIQNSSGSYYYIASPNQPRIKEVVNLFNDSTSLRLIVRELEKEAKDYGAVDVKNSVLSYLRAINIDYSSESFYGSWKWKETCGDIDEGFIQYVSNIVSHGLKFQDFCGQYVEPKKYNKNLYGSFSDLAIADGDNRPTLSMPDPFHPSDSIDVPHLFAVMDGNYSSTGSTLSLNFSNAQSDVVSWSGDLQQVVHDINKNETEYSNKTFEQIMSTPSTRAPIQDILADCDGVIMACEYLNHNYSLSDALSSYYTNAKLYDRYRRYDRFVDCVLEKPDSNWSGTRIERFEKEVHLSLGLLWDAKSERYYSNPNNIYLGYAIMKGGQMGSMPSEDSRKIVADKFCDFVRRQISLVVASC